MFTAFLRKLLGLNGSSKGDTGAEADSANIESRRVNAERADGESEDASSATVAYQENLLERSCSLWQLGDWASLAKLNFERLQYHPDRVKLALLCVAGCLAEGRGAEARTHTQLALDWGCSRRVVSQVLVAGVHHTLGTAAMALGDQRRALGHFQEAASTKCQQHTMPLWAETQILRADVRLGLLQKAVQSS